ncbi:hypothetical protein ACFYO9_01070 [Streptomyces sp. NPDC005863]|uniref:hypothetical protein n=1 Tax=unclassified Streptomyces TaxID=2593676 RepID=UPI0033F23D81
MAALLGPDHALGMFLIGSQLRQPYLLDRHVHIQDVVVSQPRSSEAAAPELLEKPIPVVEDAL